jgi:poly-beta-hydroxyalkanoate depolymerase
MVTPQTIEQRLLTLSKEVDEAHNYLEDAERGYHRAKAAFEIAVAKARLSHNQSKLRVQDIQDLALLQTEAEYQALQIAEAQVKAARANATRIRTQVDIARSVGTSVRASLEI